MRSGLAVLVILCCLEGWISIPKLAASMNNRSKQAGSRAGSLGANAARSDSPALHGSVHHSNWVDLGFSKTDGTVADKLRIPDDPQTNYSIAAASQNPHSLSNSSRPGRQLQPGLKQRGRKSRGHLQYCLVEGCTISASYGSPMDRLRRYCVKHKPKGFIDCKNWRCMHPEGCTLRATYGDPGNTTTFAQGGQTKKCMPYFCSFHRRPKDKRLFRRVCTYKGCNKIPIFGSRDDHIARFCAQHKDDNDMDVINYRCLRNSSEGVPCMRRATYGVPGTKHLVSCKLHKLDHYVNLNLIYLNHPKESSRKEETVITTDPTTQRQQTIVIEMGSS